MRLPLHGQKAVLENSTLIMSARIGDVLTKGNLFDGMFLKVSLKLY